MTTATLVAINSNEAVVRSGIVCVCRSLEPGGRLFVGGFVRNLASVTVMVTDLIQFKRNFINAIKSSRTTNLVKIELYFDVSEALLPLKRCSVVPF